MATRWTLRLLTLAACAPPPTCTDKPKFGDNILELAKRNDASACVAWIKQSDFPLTLATLRWLDYSPYFAVFLALQFAFVVIKLGSMYCATISRSNWGSSSHCMDFGGVDYAILLFLAAMCPMLLLSAVVTPDALQKKQRGRSLVLQFLRCAWFAAVMLADHMCCWNTYFRGGGCFL